MKEEYKMANYGHAKGRVMKQNKLLRRLEALEEIVKPKVTEIPPEAQAIIDRMLAARAERLKITTPEDEKHEK